MRVIVTGSRDWQNVGLLETALSGVWLFSEYTFTLIHGGCPTGADKMADEWGATKDGVTIEVFEADWGTHHKAAGPIRNQRMVDAGADLCIGFLMPGSKGTADCLKKAEKAGIPTLVFKGEEA